MAAVRRGCDRRWGDEQLGRLLGQRPIDDFGCFLQIKTRLLVEQAQIDQKMALAGQQLDALRRSLNQ